MAGALTSVILIPSNTELARTRHSKSRASISTCGRGSSGWCVGRSVSPRPNGCTIWWLDCSSTATNLGVHYNCRINSSETPSKEDAHVHQVERSDQDRPGTRAGLWYRHAGGLDEPLLGRLGRGGDRFAHGRAVDQ